MNDQKPAEPTIERLPSPESPPGQETPKASAPPGTDVSAFPGAAGQPDGCSSFEARLVRLVNELPSGGPDSPDPETDEVNLALRELAEDRDLGQLYKPLRWKASGAQGLIFEAEDLKGPNRRVALKVVRKKDEWSESYFEALLEEATKTAALKSRHCVSVYRHGKTPQFAWFAMELLEGQSLRERLEKEGKLHWEFALKIVDQVLEGLQQAHQQDLTHGDLKPDNLFLTENEDRVVLLDWGVARDLNPFTATSFGTRLAGTPRYLAPECWPREDNGVVVQRARFTPQADLYALGAVLGEMLTGRKPFHTHLTTPHDMEGLKRAHRELNLADHLGDAGPFPPECRDLVARATARKLPQRYRTAAEFRTHVRALLFRPPPVQRSRPLRLGLTLLGLFLLVGALAAAWGVLFRPGTTESVRFQGDLTVLLLTRNGQRFPQPRRLGGPSTDHLGTGDGVQVQARLSEGPAAHCYVLWIDSTGKVTLLHPRGWTWSQLPGDRKCASLVWPPGGGSAALTNSPSGLEAVLWLVRARPLTEADNAQLRELLSEPHLKWRQPREWTGEPITVWFEDGRLAERRGAPDLRTARVPDDPITQTQKALLAIKDRGLAEYSRAVCFSFVGQ